MSAKVVTFSALVASAAAFSPALSGVRTGATSLSMAMDKSARAPIITIFDHRGCSRHSNTEYKGRLTGTQDDEMCIKVGTAKIIGEKGTAERVLADSLTTLKK
jgi:hypothetical protein